MLTIFGIKREEAKTWVYLLWSWGVMERSLFVSTTSGRYSFILTVDKSELIKRYSAFTEAAHCLSPHPSVKSRHPHSSVIQTIFGFCEGWNSSPILFILKSWKSWCWQYSEWNAKKRRREFICYGVKGLWSYGEEFIRFHHVGQIFVYSDRRQIGAY